MRKSVTDRERLKTKEKKITPVVYTRERRICSQWESTVTEKKYQALRVRGGMAYIKQSLTYG